MSNVKRLMISVLMLACVAMAQTPKPKEDASTAKWSTTTSTVFAAQNPPQASYTEKITKDGHYLVTFDDPNREFICSITAASPENRWTISTLTIVCMRVHTVIDEREVKP